ncbi:SMP-30/Gluconolaconase/LRE-like region-domain-containing protein [Astrocystis sublimbata]|nr:SMP-30/Gluconolaconase/LRE-like region-domain-containing protein [Astrocystis sublimbata]
MIAYTAEEWLPAEAGLGESPLYRPEDDTFFFVDIKNCRVHSVPLSRGWASRHTIQLDEPITRLDLVEGRLDRLAVLTRRGFALLDTTSGALERIADLRHHDAELDGKIRMNDGGIDVRGRWWATTMALDEESKIGRLWRYDGSGKVQDMSGGEMAAVVNGVVVWFLFFTLLSVLRTATDKSASETPAHSLIVNNC